MFRTTTMNRNTPTLIIVAINICTSCLNLNLIISIVEQISTARHASPVHHYILRSQSAYQRSLGVQWSYRLYTAFMFDLTCCMFQRAPKNNLAFATTNTVGFELGWDFELRWDDTRLVYFRLWWKQQYDEVVKQTDNTPPPLLLIRVQ